MHVEFSSCTVTELFQVRHGTPKSFSSHYPAYMYKHVAKVRSRKIAASIAILKWWHKEQEESENVNPQSHRKKLTALAIVTYM